MLLSSTPLTAAADGWKLYYNHLWVYIIVVAMQLPATNGSTEQTGAEQHYMFTEEEVVRHLGSSVGG